MDSSARSLLDVAFDVIKGKYDTGISRIKWLEQLGYDPKAVNREVVQIYTLAHKVRLGDFGESEHERKIKLGRYYAPVCYVLGKYF